MNLASSIPIKEYVDKIVDIVRAKVDMNAAWTQEQFTISERQRGEALDKAANTIQVGLDKAERTLQISLDKAERNLQVALEAAEKRVNEKFDVQQKASAKEMDAVKEKLIEGNRYRQQIDQERALYVTRDQLDLNLKAIIGELKPIQQSQLITKGRDLALIAIFTVIVGLVSIVLKFWH